MSVSIDRRETGRGDPDGLAGGAGGSAPRGIDRRETGGGAGASGIDRRRLAPEHRR
jgi:hypothetical protein